MASEGGRVHSNGKTTVFKNQGLTIQMCRYRVQVPTANNVLT